MTERTLERDDDLTPTWEEIAYAGACTLVLLTRSYAFSVGLPLTRADVEFVGLVYNDELPNVIVGFLSIQKLREFVREMKPRSVQVLASPTEDAQEIDASIKSEAGLATLH